MRSYRYICICAVLCTISFSGCYQYDPPPEVLLGTHLLPQNRSETDKQLQEMRQLSLASAKDIAVQNNQNYQATLHFVNAARMRYYQALGAYAPEIRVGVATGQNLGRSYTMVTPPMGIAGYENNYQVNTTISASWLLFDGFARYLTTQITKSDWRREQAERMRVLCMLKRSVAYAYYDIQLARELRQIQQGNIQFQNKLYALTASQVEKGTRFHDDALNFNVVAVLAEYAVIEANNQENVANYALSLLMGYPEGQLPGAVNIAPFPDTLGRIYYDVNSCVDIALANSPMMHTMREMLRIARYNQWKSYSSYFPTVFADFNFRNTYWNSTYREYRVPNSSYGQNTIGYGLRAEWLLFNGLARYNAMREMQSKFAAAEFNMAQTYLQVMNDVRAAYSTYETAYERFTLSRTLLKSSLQLRELVFARYVKNQSSVARMDITQRYYIDVQTLYAVAVIDFLKAIAQLEAIMMIDLELALQPSSA